MEEVEYRGLSRRQMEVNDLTKHIKLLCSRGCSPADPEFVHFIDVVWPIVAQFINKETAVSMNRLLTTQWDELELVPDSEDEEESGSSPSS